MNKMGMYDKKTSKKEIDSLENQLSCPSGNEGIEIGNNMNKTNISMTLATIDFLNIADDDHILELGHGNCGHIDNIMTRAKNLQYHGLEISETMSTEAQKNSENYNASFSLYDGLNIPFENESFDKIMTVNTIYFWSEPIALLSEIERIIKVGSTCIINYVEESFMKNLSFVQTKFTLYNRKKIENLVHQTNLKIIDFQSQTEMVESKTGESVERIFSMVKLQK